MHLLLHGWFAAAMAFGTSSADDMDFSFPSAVTSVRSPSHSLVAGYRRGRYSDGIQEFEFSVSDNASRHLAGFAFTRSVRGSWSPNGRGLIVNNYIGSNVTDCQVSRSHRRDLRMTSVTGLLTAGRGRGGALIPESPDNSHFYLTCSRWLDDSAVEISIRGYVDAQADFGREFSYRFRFRPETGTFERLE